MWVPHGNVFTVHFCHLCKDWHHGLPQPAPWWKGGCVMSTCSPVTTFHPRTKSNALSFACPTLYTGAVWDCREGRVSKFSRFSPTGIGGFGWAIDCCWVAVRIEISFRSGLLAARPGSAAVRCEGGSQQSVWVGPGLLLFLGDPDPLHTSVACGNFESSPWL